MLSLSLLCCILIVLEITTTTTVFSFSLSSFKPPSSSLFATKNKENGSSAATSSPKMYPPLSRDEVQAFLDTIPVYAVTEPNQEDGLVLLKEQNNPNKEIAYFFFSPEAANKVFAPLRQQKSNTNTDAGWNVSAYPLGLVWLELINSNTKNNDDDRSASSVDYRLLPEREDLIGAQNLLREQAKQQGKSPKIVDELGLFSQPYNEIPIFVDQFLRVVPAAAAAEGSSTKKEGEEKVPMYVGLNDLMETCNQAIKASSGSYQAAMSVISLSDLVEEMMKVEGNANDYRKVVLVPPTMTDESRATGSIISLPEKEDDDVLTWAGKINNNLEGNNNNNNEISIPTATNNWSD